MDPTSIAIVAVVIAAASEVISYLPIRENGVVQVAVKILKLLFPKR